MSRVLIADDHAVVRAGYRQFLETEPSITEIGEASTGNETLNALRKETWNLLLMDINMPERSGLDILRHVTASHPRLRAGAGGYLSKGGSPEELLKAVRIVLSGRRYVSASLAESMAADLEDAGKQAQPPHDALSSREFQIFCKLAAGASVKHIADELSLSSKTVSTYRSRILEEMSFMSNADITTYALRNGLIQ
jgi:two-component system, NarL family, invasion response regulator UvrY